MEQPNQESGPRQEALAIPTHAPCCAMCALGLCGDCDAMSIKHPIDGEICYDTDEAPPWLTEHGLPTSPGSLARNALMAVMDHYGLKSESECIIENPPCVNISFPNLHQRFAAQVS
jgi:hypothetical protein